MYVSGTIGGGSREPLLLASQSLDYNGIYDSNTNSYIHEDCDDDDYDDDLTHIINTDIDDADIDTDVDIVEEQAHINRILYNDNDNDNHNFTDFTFEQPICSYPFTNFMQPINPFDDIDLFYQIHNIDRQPSTHLDNLQYQY